LLAEFFYDIDFMQGLFFGKIKEVDKF